MLHAAVLAALRGNAGVVSALGGASPEKRIYLGAAPSGAAYPMLVLIKVSERRRPFFAGQLSSHSACLMQMDAYSRDVRSQLALGRALVALWNGHSSESIPFAEVVGNRESVERGVGDKPIYRVSIDVNLKFKEQTG